MEASRTWWLAAVLVIGAAAAGCGRTVAETPAGTGAPSPARPSAAEMAELEAIYRARTDSARMRFTEADVRFMTGMIHHHAQALEMARLAESNDGSPAVRVLAGRIINGQTDEITTMQTWLRDRGQPVPELHMTGDAVMVHGGAHAMHMPGMLTAEQLRELAGARGTAFDRLFLTRMIEHHRGAVTMVEELFSTDGAGQDEDVFRFASDVQVDQKTEIARMELMLAALPAGG